MIFIFVLTVVDNRVVEYTLQLVKNVMAFSRILHVMLIPSIFATPVRAHQSVSCANVTIQSFNSLPPLLHQYIILILLQSQILLILFYLPIHVVVAVSGATFYAGVYVVVWIVDGNRHLAHTVVHRHGTVVVELATGLGVDVRAPNHQRDVFSKVHRDK